LTQDWSFSILFPPPTPFLYGKYNLAEDSKRQRVLIKMRGYLLCLLLRKHSAMTPFVKWKF